MASLSFLSDRTENFILHVRKALEDEHYPRAVTLCSHAISCDNQNPLLFFLRSEANYGVGKLEEALNDALIANSLGGKNFDILKHASKIAIELEKFEVARPMLEEAQIIALGSVDGDVHLHKEIQNICSLYDRCPRLASEDGLISNARQALDGKDFTKAVKLYTDAISSNHNVPDLFYCRAIGNFELGNFQGVVDDTYLASMLEPSRTDIIILGGEALLKLKEFGQAHKVLNEAKKFALGDDEARSVDQLLEECSLRIADELVKEDEAEQGKKEDFKSMSSKGEKKKKKKKKMKKSGKTDTFAGMGKNGTLDKHFVE